MKLSAAVLLSLAVYVSASSLTKPDIVKASSAQMKTYLSVDADRAVVVANIADTKPDQYRDANITDMIKLAKAISTNYSCLSAGPFEDKIFVDELYTKYTTDGKTAADFLNTLDDSQLKAIFEKKLTIKDAIDVDMLNSLEKHRSEKYKDMSIFKKLSIEALNNVFKGTPGHLNEKIIENLRDDFLEKTTGKPNKEDGKYWTTKQLGCLSKNMSIEFDYCTETQVKALKKEYVAKLMKAGDRLNKDQCSALTKDQLNRIFQDVAACPKIPKDVDFMNISELEIKPDCFNKLEPENQYKILLSHPNLDKGILSKVTHTKVQEYKNETSDKTGLEALRYIKDPSLLKMLGADAGSDNPYKEVTTDKLNGDLDFLRPYLNAKGIKAMKLPVFEKLSDLKETGDLYCHDENIFIVILMKIKEGMDKTPIDAAEANFWKNMDSETAKKLFGPEYSVLAKSIKLEDFTELSDAAAKVVPAHQLTFLKTLKKEQIARLGDKAFAGLTAEHVGQVDLVNVADEQLGNVAPEFLAKLPIPALVAQTPRVGLFTSEQLKALPNTSFLALVNKESVKSVGEDALKETTSEQLKGAESGFYGSLSGKQVANIGLLIEDAKISAISAVVANKKHLSAEGLAALDARVSGNAAVSAASVSAGVLAAAAVLALLA